MSLTCDGKLVIWHGNKQHYWDSEFKGRCVNKKYLHSGMPAVITLACYFYDKTTDDVPIPQALRELELMGADVVGINCGRGPATMMSLLRECRKACKGPLAALPVPFRTTEKERTFHSLTDPLSGKRCFPSDLGCMSCNRTDIRDFAREARQIGVQYIGLCCGSLSSLLREIAIEYGRSPPSLKYAPAVGLNVFTGKHATKRAALCAARVMGLEDPAWFVFRSRV